MDDGLPKLWVLLRALHLRRTYPDWFGKDSTYLPIEARGPKRDHLIAYQRGQNVIVIAARWNAKISGSLGATEIDLPTGSWIHLFTDETIQGGPLRAQDLMKRFPVALLMRNGE